MEEASDRRTFLRSLASQAVRGAQVISPIPTVLLPTAPGTEADAPAVLPAPGPAAAATSCAGHDELLELADELDLTDRGEALRQLARPSCRLSLELEQAKTAVVGFAGGAPELPAELGLAASEEPELEFLACVDLDATAGAAGHPALPSAGRIWLFSGPESQPRIAHEPAGSGRRPVAAPHGSRPLHASAELVLPRPWSAAVEELELSQREVVAWQRLRQRLADAQGVETADTAQHPAPIHRAFGYPDETSRTQLPPRGGRMLLQLSSDPDFDWHWGPADRRLYVWEPAPGDPDSTDAGEARALLV